MRRVSILFDSKQRIEKIGAFFRATRHQKNPDFFFFFSVIFGPGLRACGTYPALQSKDQCTCAHIDFDIIRVYAAKSEYLRRKRGE